ncbi:hypothetical protein NEMIN01_0444 [Nematocida minor]|uniref:uncharacterized protein n=1 Tax=Nematocida minor TaxID=1912983 RepID=UPI0022201407|nr:uncharacterized protein NEMIN01_0444 [Nematocida minor]KAI5189381.1 hypothetical protein NEMIN01_0444 [Nematocida minor]
MKDTEDILEEFNINAEEVEKKESDKVDCKKQKKDPYCLVEEALNGLDVEDLDTARMVLTNSLNESMMERERLIRNNFTTYIKCRKVLERMQNTKKEADVSGYFEIEAVKALELTINPILVENKEIHRKQQQRDFILNNSLLFNAESILSDYLKINDFDSFLTDYKLVKKEAERFENSKFVSYLFSKTIPILAKFKIEIVRRIETCKSIPESLHYFKIYMQVDPESYNRAFATLLTIAKTEIGAKRVAMHKTALNHLKNIKEFAEDQTETLIHMVDSMKAVDLVCSQEKKMNDFLVNAIEAYATSLKKELLEFLKEKKNENIADEKIPMKQRVFLVSEIVDGIESIADKVRLEGIDDILEISEINSVFSALIKILWREADVGGVDEMYTLINSSRSMYGIRRHLSSQIKEFLVKIISRAESAGSTKLSHLVRELSKVTVEILPKVENFLGPDERGEIENRTAELKEKIKIVGKEELKCRMLQALCDEELLMAVLRVKVIFMENYLKNTEIENKIISEALADIKLNSDVSKYVLRKYLPEKTVLGVLEQTVMNYTKCKKQFSALID